MADHFERAWQDILLRTEKNGGPTPRDLLLAMKALADDDDEKHEENMAAVAGAAQLAADAREALDMHCAEAAVYFQETDELIRWRTTAADDCEARMRRVAHEVSKAEHERVHNDYVASLADQNFNDRLLMFFATTTGKLVLVVLGAAAIMLLNYVVYGRP